MGLGWESGGKCTNGSTFSKSMEFILDRGTDGVEDEELGVKTQEADDWKGP